MRNRDFFFFFFSYSCCCFLNDFNKADYGERSPAKGGGEFVGLEGGRTQEVFSSSFNLSSFLSFSFLFFFFHSMIFAPEYLDNEPFR